MRRLSTTVISIVGTGSSSRLDALDGAGNVRVIRPDDGAALDRAVAGWREAMSSGSRFTVHDADPLADVATAWVRRFTAPDSGGELEVAVATATQRVAAGSLDLPDYYLVTDIDDMDATTRHWYLGLLHGAAPSRVIPVDVDDLTGARALRALPSGRWWPPVTELLDGIEHIVPDRAGPLAPPPSAKVDR